MTLFSYPFSSTGSVAKPALTQLALARGAESHHLPVKCARVLSNSLQIQFGAHGIKTQREKWAQWLLGRTHLK